jgi:hypothetical protein
METNQNPKGTPVPNPLQVRIIDDSTVEIAATLGIDGKREKELDRLIARAYHGNETLTDSMVEYSQQCKSANELAYGIFHMGVKRSRGNGSAGGFIDFLKAMGGREGRGE